MMRRQVGLPAMVVVVALTGALAVMAYAEVDPTQLTCAGGWRRAGVSEPSNFHSSSTEAARAFVSEATTMDGSEIPAEAELIDVTSGGALDTQNRDVAVQVDGKTVMILGVERWSDGWAVTSDIRC